MKSAQGYGRSWLLKIFSIFSSGGHLVYWGGTFLAILVGSHLDNIPMKFELRWQVQEELAFEANYLRFSIFSSGGHFVHRSVTVLAILVEGTLSNIHM